MTISASSLTAIGVDASDKTAAEAKGPRNGSLEYVFDALHEDFRLVRCQGRDQRVRARVYTAYASTGGATANILHIG
jgi:hypothetical protein